MENQGFRLLSVFIVMLNLSACGGDAPVKATLFDRLGGQASIDALVSDMVDIVGADERIMQNEVVKVRMTAADPVLFKSSLSQFMCSVTGGPCEYAGRDMKTAHEGLGITTAEFGYVGEAISVALDKHKVAEAEKNELLGMLDKMKPDIIEVP